MNKTIKIIIAFGIAILLTATVLVVSIVKGDSENKQQTSAPIYTLQPTTLPGVPSVTESWVDLNMIASNLATATDPTMSDTSTTLPIGITQVVIPNYNVTSIVYVDQNGNIIDPNQLTQNNQSTQNNQPTYDNTDAFDTPVSTTEPEGEMSEFEINSSGIVTGYYGSSNYVMLPSKIQGKTVVGIGDNCFKGSKIISIQIPETVKSIGNSAFQECKSLTNVIFANQNVDVTIGKAAFKHCEKLKNINLPVTSSIGASAFEGCTSLETLDIKKGCKNIDLYCFAYCTSLTKLTIRDEQTAFKGVTAFSGCDYSKLIVYCVSDSDTEFTLKNYGLNTAPITQ